jgi:type 1 fimbria pilin
VLNKDNTSAINIVNYKGSTTTYSDITLSARFQKVDSAKTVTPGGVLSQVQISVSYK